MSEAGKLVGDLAGIGVAVLPGKNRPDDALTLALQHRHADESLELVEAAILDVIELLGNENRFEHDSVKTTLLEKVLRGHRQHDTPHRGKLAVAAQVIEVLRTNTGSIGASLLTLGIVNVDSVVVGAVLAWRRAPFVVVVVAAAASAALLRLAGVP